MRLAACILGRDQWHHGRSQDETKYSHMDQNHANILWSPSLHRSAKKQLIPSQSFINSTQRINSTQDPTADTKKKNNNPETFTGRVQRMLNYDLLTNILTIYLCAITISSYIIKILSLHLSHHIWPILDSWRFSMVVLFQSVLGSTFALHRSLICLHLHYPWRSACTRKLPINCNTAFSLNFISSILFQATTVDGFQQQTDQIVSCLLTQKWP